MHCSMRGGFSKRLVHTATADHGVKQFPCVVSGAESDCQHRYSSIDRSTSTDAGTCMKQHYTCKHQKHTF